MSFLYVMEQGAYVRKKGGRIVVIKDSEVLAERPVREIAAMVIFGGVHPTTDALMALLDHGADVAMMTRNGHFRGILNSAKGKNSVLRANQYKLFSNKSQCAAMARRYVKAKIRNGRAVLLAYHYSSGNPYRMSDTVRKSFDACSEAISSEKCCDLPTLRGYEGAAGKLYFQEFSKCLLHGRAFAGRIYHPSTDPVNAILSFGYSFVARELQAALEACGLDPYIGFYHEVTYGRASLSLDLMEEFRNPLVDRLVLKLFNRKMLDDDDFEKDEKTGQVYLKKEALKVFIRHYEEWCNDKNRIWEQDSQRSWREVIWKQCEKLRHAITNDTAYYPFCCEQETNGCLNNPGEAA